MESLIPLLFKIENIGLLISVLGNIGLGWLHVVWRREERADRTVMLDIVTRNTAAMEGLKNILSARLGQPL